MLSFVFCMNVFIMIFLINLLINFKLFLHAIKLVFVYASIKCLLFFLSLLNVYLMILLLFFIYFDVEKNFCVNAANFFLSINLRNIAWQKRMNSDGDSWK